MKSIAPTKTNAAQITKALTDWVNPIANLLRWKLHITGVWSGVKEKNMLRCS